MVKATPETKPEEANTEVTARQAAPVSWRRVAFELHAAFGAASLIASFVMFGLGVETQSDGDEAYQDFLDNPGPDLERRYLQLDEDGDPAHRGLGRFGVGLALGGAAVAFWLLEPEPQVDRSGPSDEGPRLAPLPGGAWLGYSLRF
ncbi:MAG: hypothetical protein MZW92_06205 [Comamonadaceae bacterium]|nr:hypothetical protein [Comamonadaceae bacterium]